MTRQVSFRAALLLSVALLPLPATSQLATEEQASDPGFIERIIQNALGGDGREVRISGLEGALSSEVRIGSIQVADDEGTWLTVEDVTMNWRRLALIRGRVEIESLTVGAVDLDRAPNAPPAELPTLDVETEADPEPRQPFALPELPVAINLGQLTVSRVDLGADLLGEDAALTIDGSARLADGEGDVRLNVDTLQGPEGRVALDAGYANETRRLRVLLDVEQEAGGLIARKAQFPGEPSVDLSVTGDAPISDFTAAINLATDGQTRLSGGVTLQEEATGETVVQTIIASLGGDITALFAPEYRDFFGEDVGLDATVRLDPETGTEIPEFALTAEALDLHGQVSLLPTGLPRLIDVSGQIGASDGLPVTLPVPGAATELSSGTLSVAYDQAAGETLRARFGLLGLRQEEKAIETLSLALDGAIVTSDNPVALRRLASDVTATLAGVSLGSPEIDEALAEPLSLTGRIDFDPEAKTLVVEGLDLETGDTRLAGDVNVTDLGGETNVAVAAQLFTGDLERFAPLTGQALDGAFDGTVDARYTVLGGAFAVTLDGKSDGLAIGNPQVDPLIGGDALVGLTARRDPDGITLQRLAITTDQLDVNGTGRLSSTVGVLDFDARLAEAGVLAPQFSGPLEVRANVSGGGEEFDLSLIAGDEAITGLLGDPVRLYGDITYVPQEGRIGTADLSLTAGGLLAEGAAEVVGLNDGPSLSADLDLDTGDLARFARITGLPLAGSLDARLQAAADTEAQSFDLTLKGEGQDIAIGTAQVDELLAGATDIDIAASAADMVLNVARLRLVNPQLSLTGGGTLSTEDADLTVAAALQEAGTLVPHLAGPVTLDATVMGTDSTYDIALKGAGRAVTDALGDALDLTARVARDAAAGTLDVPALRLSAGELTASGNAQVTGLNDAAAVVVALDLDTGNLARMAALTGLPLQGTLRADVDGSFDSASGDFDATLSGRGQDIAIGTAQVDQLLRGITDIELDASRAGDIIEITRVDITNPALTVDGTGRIAPEGGKVDLDARLADLGLFVPQVSGPLTLTADATGAGSAWTVAADAQGPAGIRANVAGDVDGAVMDLDISAGLGSLATFVPQLTGGLSVDGNVRGTGTDYFVDLAATSPTGLNARVDGRAWGPAGTSDLAITGSVPLALAEGFIRPRSVSGTLNADLRLNGAPGLDALSGSITTSGARFNDPGTRIVLQNIGLNLGLASGRATVDAQADLATGGQIRIDGPVTLSPPFDGDIAVVLDRLLVQDPRLYDINVDGQVRMAGPFAGGASITGQINIPEAEIRIPATMGGGGPIIDIIHRNEPRGSQITRLRAGVKEPEPASASGATGAAVAYPLDLVISAPSRMFIRGRGLNAEIGGSIEIGGTTANVIPTGRFDLIRGTMALLGRQLTFETVQVTLGGGLVPTIYMVATGNNANADIDAQIIIQGPVNAPELSFASDPELPEDEVLSQLFFGKSVTDLTPLEVAQLVAAVRRLTGGGGGLFNSIREGLGVDQLSVGQNADGETEVTAGKYLTDEIFTDVTVDAKGTTRLDLNYQVTPSITATTGFDNEGDARIGIGFERDY